MGYEIPEYYTECSLFIKWKYANDKERESTINGFDPNRLPLPENETESMRSSLADSMLQDDSRAFGEIKFKSNFLIHYTDSASGYSSHAEGTSNTENTS